MFSALRGRNREEQPRKKEDINRMMNTNNHEIADSVDAILMSTNRIRLDFNTRGSAVSIDRIAIFVCDLPPEYDAEFERVPIRIDRIL